MANRTKDLTAVIEKYNRIKKEKGRVPVVLDFSQEEKEADLSPELSHHSSFYSVL